MDNEHPSMSTEPEQIDAGAKQPEATGDGYWYWDGKERHFRRYRTIADMKNKPEEK